MIEIPTFAMHFSFPHMENMSHANYAVGILTLNSSVANEGMLQRQLLLCGLKQRGHNGAWTFTSLLACGVMHCKCTGSNLEIKKLQ